MENIKELQDVPASLLADLISDGVILLGEDREIISTNQSTASMLERPLDEIIGKKVDDFLVKESKSFIADFIPMVDECLSATDEVIWSTASGTHLHTMISAAPLGRDDEESHGCILIVRQVDKTAVPSEISDITLADEREKYRELFNESNDAIFIHDFEGLIVDVNQCALELFGYDRSKIMSYLVYELHPVEARAHSRTAFETLLKEGVVRYESHFTKSNGEEFPAEVSSSLFRFGGKDYVQAIVRDVSERKQQEKLLRESAEHFRLLYENAPLGYQSLDKDGRLIEVNPAWLEALGYTKGEVIGASFSEFLSPEMKDIFKGRFKKFKEAGRIKDVRFKLVRKDQSEVVAVFHGRIARDEEGRFVRTHCIFHEVDEPSTQE
ncbi:MAG: PAS domain S-box protein [Candidatus Thorarchaeota archaeon]|nr:MAG: PAS domain S-box protein [Candidatus Thorarchaeota archaeon]